MTTKYRQITLKDTFSNCQDPFIEESPSFFQLLDEHFDIQEFIPLVFTNGLLPESWPESPANSR